MNPTYMKIKMLCFWALLEALVCGPVQLYWVILKFFMMLKLITGLLGRPKLAITCVCVCVRAHIKKMIACCT